MTGPGPRILLRDVAKRANVSGSTASRALADDPRISVATRELVKAAAVHLHYVPNAAARSLRVRRTRTLGLLLPDVRDPVHGQIASAFEQEASQAGYCVIVVSGERDAARERIGLRTFAEHGTDGVAVVSSLLSPRELRERVDPERLVHAWPDHRTMPRTGGPAQPGVVQTDDAGGVRAAVSHLIDGGSRRIAYAGDGVRASNTVRAEATAATLRERRIRPALRTFVAPNGADRAEELAGQVAAVQPDAVVCYDDKLALELMDALRRLGIGVPDDIGIVGFDGIPFAAISNPRLTTVAVPSEEIGRQSAALLIRAVIEGRMPDGVLLPVEFVVRESTRPGPGSPPARSDG
ncbi:MAG: LacI family DNA-binding transcriptional regulator [Candidatus Limnocylindrales bacterium]